ncbi:hypothetical protein Rrhod_0740 [Rhodococcus rhodnii LMG 5362]|uniref:Uncharacterized protein n=1 Tax=Rhodococcus rhodnii LMG 5362 TaxID=1273125 RepID=R7WRK2_9NOCA|nr:hypothetical protein Rrhod_0740 [Rhodococcus rhodnii LMG 5362]
MNPYDYAGRHDCPHCGAAVGARCTTEDGFERAIPCVDRVKLVDRWPSLPDPPASLPRRLRHIERFGTPDPAEPRHQEPQ